MKRLALMPVYAAAVVVTLAASVVVDVCEFVVEIDESVRRLESEFFVV